MGQEISEAHTDAWSFADFLAHEIGLFQAYGQAKFWASLCKLVPFQCVVSALRRHRITSPETGPVVAVAHRRLRLNSWPSVLVCKHTPSGYVYIYIYIYIEHISDILWGIFT